MTYNFGGVLPIIAIGQTVARLRVSGCSSCYNAMRAAGAIPHSVVQYLLDA